MTIHPECPTRPECPNCGSIGAVRADRPQPGLFLVSR